MSNSDVSHFLAGLPTAELEEIAREASALLTRRKTPDKKAREAHLISRLNTECVLSEAHWARFRELTEKQDAAAGQLTEKEQEELFQLIEEEENMRVVRVKIMGELAQLKGISLPALAQQLGIKQMQNA